MKCPECGYTSFDHLEQCRKCGAGLSPVPVFRYLYEDELSSGAVIDGGTMRERNEVLSMAAPSVSAPGVSQGPLEQQGPPGELEDFFTFEKEIGEEIASESGDSRPRVMEPAGLGSRFLAFSIDFMFTLCVAAAALISAAYLIEETFFPGLGEFVSIWGWICLCVYGLATTYFILLPSWCGTTLGNSLAGIRVVTRDGSSAGFRTNLLRWVGWIFSVTAVFLGFALAAFDPQRRTLSDRICGTLVVRA